MKLFKSLNDFSRSFPPRNNTVLYIISFKTLPYLNRFRRKPAIPTLTRLSRLFSIHLSIMQHTQVRSSLEKVQLIKNRSVGFGSYYFN